MQIKNKPLWKGFNLLDKYHADDPDWNQRFQEQDFEMMAAWGFNFARIPCSYHCWMTEDDWLLYSEPQISNYQGIIDIDEALYFGKQYGIHISLSMHRIQGYCVNSPKEKLSIWEDEHALKTAIWQWQFFANRYIDYTNEALSFDLINEPANVTEAQYSYVIGAIIEGIRAVDSNRTIIVNGLDYGKIPVNSLKKERVIQSTRGYHPYHLTHFAAPWAENSLEFPEPNWPYQAYNEFWDEKHLFNIAVLPWLELENAGNQIHVGEWGSYRFTPHDITLKWMKASLNVWKKANWGWALWNLKGSFGILNSMRSDVQYENYNGLLLDRKMLELLIEDL